MALSSSHSLYISSGKVRLSLLFSHSNQLRSLLKSYLNRSFCSLPDRASLLIIKYILTFLRRIPLSLSVIMLFSTTFSLLSISALAVAIPTHPPMTRLYPRQNNTAAASTGGEAAAVANGAAVDRAGGILNAEAAAEANQRDDTATRAFSGVSVKAPDGTCLFIDPLSGDFRQNLIPVQTKACDGSANQQFDIITQGKHIDQAGGMLVVSSEVRRFAGLLAFPSMLILE